MQGTAIIARGEAECDYLQLFHEANLFSRFFFEVLDELTYLPTYVTKFAIQGIFNLFLFRL